METRPVAQQDRQVHPSKEPRADGLGFGFLDEQLRGVSAAGKVSQEKAESAAEKQTVEEGQEYSVDERVFVDERLVGFVDLVNFLVNALVDD